MHCSKASRVETSHIRQHKKTCFSHLILTRLFGRVKDSGGSGS